MRVAHEAVAIWHADLEQGFMVQPCVRWHDAVLIQQECTDGIHFIGVSKVVDVRLERLPKRSDAAFVRLRDEILRDLNALG